MTDRWIWLVLLAVMAAYVGWRAVVLFKQGRYGFVIALAFVGLFCIYEAVWQVLEATGVIR